jgi:hypothetical protein
MSEYRLAPGWVNKELQLLDKNFFGLFNPFTNKWEVRKWLVNNPINWKYDSTLIQTCEYNEICGWDIDYLRQSICNARHVKEFLQSMDEYNSHLAEEADRDLDFRVHDAAHKIYNYYKRPTFIIHRDN